jgi:hypothetical protein
MKPIFLIVAALLIGAALLPTSPAKSEPPKPRIDTPTVEPDLGTIDQTCHCPNGGECNCDPCECEPNHSEVPNSSPYGARGTPTETIYVNGHRYGVGIDGRLHWMSEASATNHVAMPQTTWQPQAAPTYRSTITGGSCANGSCSVPQRRGLFGRR